jgi:hypothetical protein
MARGPGRYPIVDVASRDRFLEALGASHSSPRLTKIDGFILGYRYTTSGLRGVATATNINLRYPWLISLKMDHGYGQ